MEIVQLLSLRKLNCECAEVFRGILMWFLDLHFGGQNIILVKLGVFSDL